MGATVDGIVAGSGAVFEAKFMLPWMSEPMLDAFDGLPGVARIPGAVEVLGDSPELDNKVAGEVLRLAFASLLAPEAGEGGFIVAHDDWGIRAAEEATAVKKLQPFGGDVGRDLRHCPFSFNQVSSYRY
jgi:hypothetical protein